MSIIGDDIWDKFEFVENNVDLLLASFSKNRPSTNDFIETGTDDWMGASRFDSTKELEGYDNVTNPLCPDCMLNGNCKRKHAKQVNLQPAILNGRKSIVSAAVRKLDFDCGNANARPINGNGFYVKKNVKNERKQKLVPKHDQVLSTETKKTKKRGKYTKKEAKINQTKNSGSKDEQMTEQNTLGDFKPREPNNNDLYCYEQLNSFNPKEIPNGLKVPSNPLTYEQLYFFNHKEISNSLKEPIKPLVSNSTKEVPPSKRSTREAKDLRNQQDRERKMQQDLGFRELSRLVPELSPPSETHKLAEHQKRDILKKTANYCTLLASWSEALGREEEYEKIKNADLRDRLMFLRK